MTFNNSDADVIDEAPLTADELSALVCGFLSYPTVYRSACRIGFVPSLFNKPGDSPYAVFMAVYGGLFEEHGHVTKSMFLTQINGLIRSNAYPVGSDVKFVLFGDDEATGLIDAAFAGPPSDTADAIAERRYTESILRRFLNARLINARLKQTLSEDTSPTDIENILQDYRKKAQAVRFVGHEAVNAARMPMPGEEIILPPPAYPTTISWIDNYIGGFRAGDVIGLLGPYAGGKTTMLGTIGTRLARQYSVEGSNKLSVYICYEDGAEKMNWLFYSAAAHIHRDRFKNIASPEQFWQSLSTPGNLFPYEHQIPSNRNGEVMLSESERWSLAVPWLNRHFVFLDFSASAATNYRGNGGVEEIVATLENLCEQTQMEIGLVNVDYTSLMLNRELAQDARTKNAEQIWRRIQQLPDEIKTHVAIPFGCTVFLAHQLAQGDIKNIPPYRHVTHGDAQGSKAFGENVHACICLNRPDPETHVSTINWSKIRFDRPASPYGLVKIDSNVVDVWQADEEYYINDISRKIMRRGEASAAITPTDSEQSYRAGSRRFNLEDAGPDVDADFLG